MSTLPAPPPGIRAAVVTPPSATRVGGAPLASPRGLRDAARTLNFGTASSAAPQPHASGPPATVNPPSVLRESKLQEALSELDSALRPLLSKRSQRAASGSPRKPAAGVIDSAVVQHAHSHAAGVTFAENAMHSASHASEAASSTATSSRAAMLPHTPSHALPPPICISATNASTESIAMRVGAAVDALSHDVRRLVSVALTGAHMNAMLPRAGHAPVYQRVHIRVLPDLSSFVYHAVGVDGVHAAASAFSVRDLSRVYVHAHPGGPPQDFSLYLIGHEDIPVLTLRAHDEVQLSDWVACLSLVHALLPDATRAHG